MISLQQPFISIIIPNYNCLDFLPACLNSIDEQVGVEKEVIIIDDGSTDGSLEYIQELMNTRTDLILVRGHRVGPGAARNLGVEVATGDYLAFLDADDTWTADKLSKQVRFMAQHPEVSLSFTNYEHINSAQELIIPCFDYWPEFQQYVKNREDNGEYQRLIDATSILFKENIVGTSSVMCRRDAYLDVGGFDTTLPSASDWDLWLKLSEVGEVGFTSAIQMYYLMREGSVSSNIPKRIEAMKIIAERHMSEASAQCPDVKRFVDGRLMDAYCEYANEHKNYAQRTFKHLETFICYPSMKRFKAMVKTAMVM
ncbi:glycosyltransferase family 2 protein [Vibrio hangzhouensis]|uniref:Glycosyl transferase family 2 n=1 Tax=Vibrio hangzhouensis TaxID=462991 RepID=A0A1H5ZYF7_9VIBR|nr:glycosyltransferase family 2 protein [Vibrio hangzhouensis]SEG41180.1 Glycosyl transferase family 2 [Vibrio hangzhouensis]